MYMNLQMHAHENVTYIIYISHLGGEVFICAGGVELEDCCARGRVEVFLPVVDQILTTPPPPPPLPKWFYTNTLLLSGELFATGTITESTNTLFGLTINVRSSHSYS